MVRAQHYAQLWGFHSAAHLIRVVASFAKPASDGQPMDRELARIGFE
jgi:hypothetical protein